MVLVPIGQLVLVILIPCREDRDCALDLRRNYRRAWSGYRRTSQRADRLRE